MKSMARSVSHGVSLSASSMFALASVGAAPTPRDVLEFFHAIGVKLAEGWGMSETTALGTLSHPDEIRIGTVGKPAPGLEIKLAEDGEVLIRGANIMQSYRNLPEKTAETIDADGWLATGDVGEIDDDGYLKIVDRKKELIINAAGKNMSPANIESALKGACPLIGQACVIGDRRPYNAALIVLDPDYAQAWAKERGLGDASLVALAADERVRAAVQEGVDAGNARLSRVEQVKKFTLLATDWLPGGDELTPTMKLKRKPIAEKYADEIDAMYAGYLERQAQDVVAFRKDEALEIPEDLDFAKIVGLSNEMRQKFGDARPATLGAAARIAGVTPAALSLLLAHVKKRRAA